MLLTKCNLKFTNFGPQKGRHFKRAKLGNTPLPVTHLSQISVLRRPALQRSDSSAKPSTLVSKVSGHWGGERGECPSPSLLLTRSNCKCVSGISLTCGRAGWTRTRRARKTGTQRSKPFALAPHRCLGIVPAWPGAEWTCAKWCASSRRSCPSQGTT